MGAPGGGKGTIAKKLLKDFKITAISTGNILRSHIIDKTPIGKEAESYVKDGKLVPDSVVLNILKQELDTKKGETILLDGFPRTPAQAEKLKEFFSVDVVVNLEVPHDVIADRMSQRWIHMASGRTYAYDYNPPKVKGLDDVTGEELEQRPDDKAEVVKARLVTYEAQKTPLLAHFRALEGCTVETFKGSESNVIYPEVKAFLSNTFQL